MGSGGGQTETGEDSMNDILRITAAEAVMPGVLKVVWNDGYEGIVDLRGVIAEGEVFAHIRDPENFKKRSGRKLRALDLLGRGGG
jgi:hypothetical protein